VEGVLPSPLDHGSSRPNADILSSVKRSPKVPVGLRFDGPASETENTFPLVL